MAASATMQSIFLPTPSAASGLSTRSAAPISLAGFKRRARRNANMGAVKIALQIFQNMVASKLCDSCKSATSSMFYKNDSAFLCIPCDSKIHAANKVASRHARIWMCEVCKQAPAHVTCKADAAALCVSCDRDNHSVNPLARHDERFPVVPFYESVICMRTQSDSIKTLLIMMGGFVLTLSCTVS